MSHRIKRTFRCTTHSKCIGKLRAVANGMTNNPHFTEPFKASNVPSMEKYLEAIERYQTAIYDAANGDRVKIALRNEIQAEVCDMTEQLARYVEVEAGNNHTALLTSGFELTGERGTTAKPTLAAPENFKVVNLETRGSVVGTASRMPGAGSYEIHLCLGDPKVEEEWTHKGVFIKPLNMKIDGLDAGKEYFFRARAIGEDGPGPWSSPVNTIVT